MLFAFDFLPFVLVFLTIIPLSLVSFFSFLTILIILLLAFISASVILTIFAFLVLEINFVSGIRLVFVVLVILRGAGIVDLTALVLVQIDFTHFPIHVVVSLLAVIFSFDVLLLHVVFVHALVGIRFDSVLLVTLLLVLLVLVFLVLSAVCVKLTRVFDLIRFIVNT